QALTPPARPPGAAAQGWPSGRDQPLPEWAGGDVLDDPAAVAGVDPTGFLRTVEGLPAQLEDAVGLARSVDGLPSTDGLRSIAVLGMGGSGISGEVCRALLAPLAPVPVATIRDYDLPGWVGADTLTF